MVLVTHELRAPISTIYSCLELALSGYAAPDKAREVLARAQNRATEMLGFISDLLSLTRIREQAVQWEQVPLTQLESVLQEVVALMKVEAERKDIFLGVDVAPGLAPVRALPDQIKLVWTNLLSNAIKYTDPCGIVQVSLSQDAEQLIGTVRDTGIGITPEQIYQPEIKLGSLIATWEVLPEDNPLGEKKHEGSKPAIRTLMTLRKDGTCRVFNRDHPDPQPLILEINYYFGRRGLGGSLKYYRLLLNAIREWLEENGFDSRKVKLV